MELTPLRYFHETAKTGSIRRAAENLHVTPSSISRMIAVLEQDFGAPLFERTRTGMRLTAAGQVLSRQTQRMFRDLDRVRAAIDDLRGIRRGQVSIYGPEGLVAEFLPRVLSEFQEKYPSISCQVFFGSTDRIVEAVVDDETDIGITFNGPERADLATIAEFVEPLKCLVGPRHPLADKTEVSLQQVIAFPLALPEVSFGMRRMIDEAIASEKLTPRISINTNSLELAKRMAMAGSAIAFMPGFMVQDDVAAGRLRSITVDTPIFLGSRVTVCIHRDRELSFAAREFLQFLRLGFEGIGAHPAETERCVTRNRSLSK